MIPTKTGIGGWLMVCQGKHISRSYWLRYDSAWITSEHEDPAHYVERFKLYKKDLSLFRSGGFRPNENPERWVVIPVEFFNGEIAGNTNEYGEIHP